MSTNSSCSTPYAALYAYLKGRYADNLVLTFGQIEDLLGFALPAAAHLEIEWWSGAAERSPQSRAWTDAKRTVTPNLVSRTVRFERDGV
jgi:hypothetical protein